MAELAVALDTPHVDQACVWAGAVSESVDVLKLGLEFYLRNGSDGVLSVRRSAPDCSLFLDLKLHDIPATVAGGARSVASLRPEYLTVHASGGSAMVSAAAEALPQSRITAVTVLTSLSGQDAAALGLGADTGSVAEAWARLAVSAGARAVVSSAMETARLRGALASDVHLVTPGIRPIGAAANDQARITTPEDAVAAGSDVLVVGRPITQAGDPAGVARAIAKSLG